MTLTTRGQQSDRWLKLSFDRKVSPLGIYQASRDRWVPTFPNSFGLPAGVSCPGKTAFCSSCYGERSEQSAGVHELLSHNFRLLTQAGSTDRMAVLLGEMLARFERDAIARRLIEHELIFRIHWDGDFFSLEYARAWAAAIMQFPQIRFWAYTRSFTPDVNVVPVLAWLPNLTLYLSVDDENAEHASPLLDTYPQLRVALCAVDLRTARQLVPDAGAVPCPENIGRMPLMADGVGACVSCGICPTGRRSIMFATSHRDDVTVSIPVPRPRPAPRARPAPRTHLEGPQLCARPDCAKLLPPYPGKGRPQKYCSADCRLAHYQEKRSA